MPLHPQAEAFVQAIALQNRPGWETMDPKVARPLFDRYVDYCGEKVELRLVRDELVSHVPVRIYRNHPSPNDGSDVPPCLVYFHGGGWVLGNIETHDALCRQLAVRSGCVVISVDYGLAPENAFPGPLDDCLLITQWVAKSAENLGIDATRIGVAGDSAGGNLAAAVALNSAKAGWPHIALQILIYPITDANFQTPSYRDFETGFGLTRATMQWFWKQYIGETSGPIDDRAAVLHSDIPTGLAPAHVVTAEYDVLRDEGEAYHEKLGSEGIPATLRRYDGQLHGFIHFAGLFDEAIQAISDIGDIVRKRFEI